MKFWSSCLYKRKTRTQRLILRSIDHDLCDYSSYHQFISNSSTITMASAQIVNCIVCKEPVRPRQQAIQCDGCFRWNHRTCNTGKLYISATFILDFWGWHLLFLIGHLVLRICSFSIGISQSVYRAAVDDGGDIDWRCPICTVYTVCSRYFWRFGLSYVLNQRANECHDQRLRKTIIIARGNWEI